MRQLLLSVLLTISSLLLVEAHDMFGRPENKMRCLRCDGDDCNTGSCVAKACFLKVTPTGETTRGCLYGKVKAPYPPECRGCETTTDGGKWCCCRNGRDCNQGRVDEFETWIAEEHFLANGEVFYHMHGNMIPAGNVTIDPEIIKDAVEMAYDILKKYFEKKHQFFITGVDVRDQDKITPAALHTLFNVAGPQAVLAGSKGRLYEEVAKRIAAVANLNRQQCICSVLFHLAPIPMAVCPYPTHDYAKSLCDVTSPYRTFNGTCNNLEYPLRGAANTPLPRFLSPDYDNMIDSPRAVGVNGQPLPSPRIVSTTIHKDSGEEHQSTERTVLVMQFGQFLDHDIDLTPVGGGEGSSTIICCPEGLGKNRSDCFPISIPADDYHYAPLNITCMNFVRSIPTPNRECTLGPRQQLNEITSYIDGSMIYGSDKKRADFLRLGQFGLMKTSEDGEPPMDEENEQHCPLKQNSPTRCIYAGDIRANEQACLRSMHTVFLRYHNDVASRLREINPSWDDEKLYQEARKIIGALIQQIAYGEWLPQLFGKYNIEDFNLDLEKKGYFTKYDITLDASIRNSFATAIFRFGHSLIPDNYTRLDESYGENAPDVRLSDTFFKPSVFELPNSVDQYVRGILDSAVPKLDRRLTREVTNRLFQVDGIGLDLASLNIQRGRDHGLPGYNTFRRFCKGIYGEERLNFKNAKDFDDLSTTHSAEVIQLLRSAYGHVNDIDLFPGALSEEPLQGSMVGPTLLCIMGRQFKFLRYGDRFWYENNKAYNRFSRDQLTAIRKVTFSKILCTTIDVDEIQPDPFQLPSVAGNERVNCDTLANLDLQPWLEGANTGDMTRDDFEHLITDEYRDSPARDPW